MRPWISFQMNLLNDLHWFYEDDTCIIHKYIKKDLFCKDTAKPRALLPSSAHPGHITTNIVYTMAFNLVRICSTADNFEKRIAELGWFSLTQTVSS